MNAVIRFYHVILLYQSSEMIPDPQKPEIRPGSEASDPSDLGSFGSEVSEAPGTSMAGTMRGSGGAPARSAESDWAGNRVETGIDWSLFGTLGVQKFEPLIHSQHIGLERLQSAESNPFHLSPFDSNRGTCWWII